MITNQLLNARREKDCFAITADRKYYETSNSFVKRSLRPSEWQLVPFKGTIHVPHFGNERLLNEAACMQFIADKTDIPVPKLLSCFEDDNAVYLITELIEGVPMSSLPVDKRKTVEKEIEGHLETLRSLKSDTWGGPTGIVVPPYRIMMKGFRMEWRMKKREEKDLVFCHNDLSTHNVIVDPETLKIKSILDWEYAGFYPPEFEGMYFRRPGPSSAINDEVSDEEALWELICANEEGFGSKWKS